MIYSHNYLIINILYLYINLLKSLEALEVKKGSNIPPKEINKLISA